MTCQILEDPPSESLNALYNPKIQLVSATIIHVPGGAILITQASPTIRNCILEGNSAEGYHDNSYSGGGGAIMVYGVAAPHIQNNIIRDNVAHNLGGRLLFTEGASGEVRNNVIIHNSCSGFNGGRCGGISISSWSSPVIENCIIWYNLAGPSTMNIDFDPMEWLDLSYCSVEITLY